MRIRRIGVLTGGGDAPGLNPALKAIVYRATAEGVEVLGYEAARWLVRFTRRRGRRGRAAGGLPGPALGP